MEEMLREYLPILVFLAVAIGLGIVLILAAVVLAVRNPDPEKVSAYECGFNDIAHFSHRFKQKHGIPPTNYKLTHFNKSLDES